MPSVTRLELEKEMDQVPQYQDLATDCLHQDSNKLVLEYDDWHTMKECLVGLILGEARIDVRVEQWCNARVNLPSVLQ